MDRAGVRHRVRGAVRSDRLVTSPGDGTSQADGDLAQAGPGEAGGVHRGYEALLNQLAADEAVMFADAVHPTHAVRAVGCWAPKDMPVAITQSSGRKRLNIHGAIDLETGNTRMLDVLVVNAADGDRGDVSWKAADPCISGQRPVSSCEAGAAVAGAVGMPDPAPLHPVILPTSGPNRTIVGIDAPGWRRSAAFRCSRRDRSACSGSAPPFRHARRRQSPHHRRDTSRRCVSARHNGWRANIRGTTITVGRARNRGVIARIVSVAICACVRYPDTAGHSRAASKSRQTGDQRCHSETHFFASLDPIPLVM